MPKQTPEERSREKREGGGPFLLPQFNKLLLLLILILAAHLLQWRAHPMPQDASSAAPALSAASTAAPDRGLPAAAQPGKSDAAAGGEGADIPARGTAAPAMKAAPPAAALTAEWATASGKTSARGAPDPNTPVLLDVAAGDAFPVVQTSGGWIQVQVDANQKGWLPAKLVTVKEMNADQVQIVQNTADAKLYRGPDETFGAARSLPAGTSLVPEQVSGQWVQFSGKMDGQSLWMKTAQAKWTAGQPPAKSVEAGKVIALSAEPEDQELPLADKTIVIDPGHGGKDPGAIATIQLVDERDVNLAVAQVLEQILRAAGAHVIMTRTSNDQYVSLAQRAEISNDNKADVFVSIHQNMFAQDPSIKGAITFYQSENSQTLAQDIEAAVTGRLGSPEVKQKVEQDQLYVLTHNLRPAVLVEGCFLSNPQELAESLLTEYQENLAKGIYQGILSYLAK